MKSTPEVKAVRWLTRMRMTQSKNKLAKGAGSTDRAIARRWGWEENIVGIGVSRKVESRKMSQDTCITVFVRRKVASHRLVDAQKIPGELELPSIGKVLTDVVEMKQSMVAHGQVRPIQPGVDIANEHGAAGTLGLLVSKSGETAVMALSCSHVLALSGAGATPGVDRIEQPFDSVADPAFNAVGVLTDDFSILRGGGVANTEDYAVARLSVEARPGQLDTGTVVDDVAPEEAKDYRVGRPTLLNGFVTKNAHGKVLAFQASWKVDELPGVGTAVFTNVVAYSTRCAKGDSGAVVLEDGTQLGLGLHIAGSTADKLGLFMPLGPLFRKHSFTLVKG